MITCIAEYGQSYCGDLAMAIRQAEVAKKCGCEYVKWQIFDPKRIAGATAKRYWDAALGGSESQIETFANNGMLTPAEWKQLKDACEKIGIKFFATPFDLEAVDLLETLGVSAYKIASGDITYKQMLQKIAATKKPVFLSTGASYMEEIGPALEWLKPCPVSLLACSLSYPCKDEDAHLARIQTLKSFGRPVGYSDHTLTPLTGLAAVAAGADILEKHCTLGGDGVPDDRMAMNPEQLAEYVRLAQVGEAMRGSAEIAPAKAELAARTGARRSLHATRDIKKGEQFKKGDFSYLRPAGPFAPADEDKLLGSTAARDIATGAQLQPEDAQIL